MSLIHTCVMLSYFTSSAASSNYTFCPIATHDFEPVEIPLGPMSYVSNKKRAIKGLERPSGKVSVRGKLQLEIRESHLCKVSRL